MPELVEVTELNRPTAPDTGAASLAAENAKSAIAPPAQTESF
jgi:hypothetical protein